jgi:hypothetical protein
LIKKSRRFFFLWSLFFFFFLVKRSVVWCKHRLNLNLTGTNVLNPMHAHLFFSSFFFSIFPLSVLCSYSR